MILKCKCSHEFQDRKHGAGRRVFNACRSSNGPRPYRCTVCGTTKTAKDN